MDYIYAILILIGLFVILASSFDLVIGHCGLISIAHPIFYAIGAYVSAMLAKEGGVPVPLAMLTGGTAAFVASVLVALPSLRVSGDYLLIASIGFQLGLIEFAKHIHSIGGAGGLTNIPSFLINDFGRGAYVILVLAVAVATGAVAVIATVVNDSTGPLPAVPITLAGSGPCTKPCRADGVLPGEAVFHNSWNRGQQ